MLDLAAIITAHVARSRFVEESLIVSEERDLGYILQVIDGARNWAVHRMSTSIWMSMGELRERCEALAAEHDAPLPEGDAGLVAAIARVHELEAREKVLHREFNITMEVEKEVFNPVIEPARDRLIDRILDTARLVGRERLPSSGILPMRGAATLTRRWKNRSRKCCRHSSARRGDERWHSQRRR